MTGMSCLVRRQREHTEDPLSAGLRLFMFAMIQHVSVEDVHKSLPLSRLARLSPA